MDALRADSTLQSGKYRIIKKLGQGGFGITYLAENTLLLGKVAIKEFFFKDYCERDDSTSCVTIPKSGNREIVERFKQKFIKEARTIFKLNHPNIVRILDVFEENGTAYYVMDYIEGESLGDMVKRRGAIPETEALGYVKDAASALEYIHSKNINHLDIKPGNLMKRKEDGKVLVIDFGVAKQYDAVTSEGTTNTPVGISLGYSPMEQYSKNGVQTFSPQSDVYALAATLFKLLTGNTPPESIKIPEYGLPVAELQEKHVSRSVIFAIAMAMKGRHDRIQSIAEFISNLSGDATVVITDPAEAERKRKEAEEKAAKEKAEVERKRKETEEKAAKEKVEVERKRKEAEEKAAKEKAEAERKRKETEEKAAKEKAKVERKRKETEEKATKKKATFVVTIVVVAIVAIWLMIPSNKNKVEEELAKITEVSYSNGISSNKNNVEEELAKITEASYSKGILTVNGIKYNMVRVEGCTFRMGATSEQDRDTYEIDIGIDIEDSVHSVTLSSYYIGKTEVTQALWKAVMGSNPSKFKGENLPVENVSWDDCQEFIRKLNSLTGQNFRLPTEAEWEFACRGGNNSLGYKYSGSDNIDNVAWYDGNSGDKTHPVATKSANELGIYDMSGNVWEWCCDWYEYYTSGAQTNPKGPESGSIRVHRGGSWIRDARYCRSSFRFNYFPTSRYCYLGLRLAL